jgi:hypothetical protein
MKLDFEVKKTFHLTLTEEEMRGLMHIFGNIPETSLIQCGIDEEVQASLDNLYDEWHNLNFKVCI